MPRSHEWCANHITQRHAAPRHADLRRAEPRHTTPHHAYRLYAAFGLHLHLHFHLNPHIYSTPPPLHQAAFLDIPLDAELRAITNEKASYKYMSAHASQFDDHFVFDSTKKRIRRSLRTKDCSKAVLLRDKILADLGMGVSA